jgi:hypothetical protein
MQPRNVFRSARLLSFLRASMLEGFRRSYEFSIGDQRRLDGGCRPRKAAVA